MKRYVSVNRLPGNSLLGEKACRTSPISIADSDRAFLVSDANPTHAHGPADSESFIHASMKPPTLTTSSITYSRIPGIRWLFDVRPRVLWIRAPPPSRYPLPQHSKTDQQGRAEGSRYLGADITTPVRFGHCRSGPRQRISKQVLCSGACQDAAHSVGKRLTVTD
jgi:hypothetical protein